MNRVKENISTTARELNLYMLECWLAKSADVVVIGAITLVLMQNCISFSVRIPAPAPTSPGVGLYGISHFPILGSESQ